MISAILIICLVCLTPFPALPLIIYYYSKLGFIDGFIVVTIASNLARLEAIVTTIKPSIKPSLE